MDPNVQEKVGGKGIGFQNLKGVRNLLRSTSLSLFKKIIRWALTLTLILTRHSHYSQWNKLTLLQHKGREGGKGRGENLLYCISLLHSCLQLTNA